MFIENIVMTNLRVYSRFIFKKKDIKKVFKKINGIMIVHIIKLCVIYTKLTSMCTIHAGKLFFVFLQNLPACALFTLVNFLITKEFE